MRIVARALLLLSVSVLPASADPYGEASTLPPSVPAGFVATVEAVAATPTSLSFSPDGSKLYVADGAGAVLEYPIVAGLVAGPPRRYVTGLRQPLGVLATEHGLFISDSVLGSPRTLGIVYRARDADGTAELETVVTGLPNGRHNTNGMALGPDGMLYITNGNSTDNGFTGSPQEVRPYSGSVLRVPPTGKDLLPDPSMVVATGFRNIFDIAFVPPGHPAYRDGMGVAAVPTNGPDGLGGFPTGEDVLAIFATQDGIVDHFAFPWCLHDRAKGGLGGFVQDPARRPTPSGDCTTLPAGAYVGLDPAKTAVRAPSALFGTHVSADGLAFNPGTNFPAEYDGDLFVAEWGNLFGTLPLGHKIVRVRFGADGAPVEVSDFTTAGLPLDVTFAPDGALWIADYAGPITRVASIL